VHDEQRIGDVAGSIPPRGAVACVVQAQALQGLAGIEMEFRRREIAFAGTGRVLRMGSEREGKEDGDGQDGALHESLLIGVTQYK
jgi:hypothetical protein